jgi:hypothetical protein
VTDVSSTKTACAQVVLQNLPAAPEIYRPGVYTAAAPTDAEQAEVTATEAHAEPAENGVRPVKLGYRTFHSGNAASDYISEVLHKLKPGEKVNEVRAAALHTATISPGSASHQPLQTQCCYSGRGH